MTINKARTGTTNPIVVGSTLTYSITATNSGNVTLTNVVNTDSKITPSTNRCAALLPGATCVLSGGHTTAADIVAGQVINAAAAVGCSLASAQAAHSKRAGSCRPVL